MSQPLNIAIVAHNAWGAMSGGRHGHVGGVERQTSLMSKWLAARGHRVSVLTWDEGQGDEAEVDGVRVFSLGRQSSGLPGLRFFTRWIALLRALRRADAGLYYQNCAEYVTGQVALWCRRHGRQFVYSVASDADVDPSLPELATLRERYLYRQGLGAATRVITQSEGQKQSLERNFRRQGVVLPMPSPGPADADYQAPAFPEATQPVILWVGRIAAVKRLDLLLDVAGLLPRMRFRVAGKPNANDPAFDALLHRARQLPNVQLLGMVNREDMAVEYRQATLLCCTSLYEGFPNTFIEAWSHGVPVVSTVDPSSLLARRGLGAHATTATAIADAIARLVSDRQGWLAASARARDYYVQNHAVDSAMEKFERLFMDVADERAGMHP